MLKIMIIILIFFVLISEQATFVMKDSHGSHFNFILNNTILIQHARDLISGRTTERSKVMGIIITKPMPWNKPWGYYLDTNSISFFDFATEVCDANIMYVQVIYL